MCKKSQTCSFIIRMWLILKQRFKKLIKMFMDELFTFGMLNFRFNLGNFFHSLGCLNCQKMWKARIPINVTSTMKMEV